jgi:hypothetical protein
VSFDRVHEPEAELVDLGKVALPGGQYRVDQPRLTGFLSAEEVGVGAGNGFEQLLEKHGYSRTLFLMYGKYIVQKFHPVISRPYGAMRIWWLSHEC